MRNNLVQRGITSDESAFVTSYCHILHDGGNINTHANTKCKLFTSIPKESMKELSFKHMLISGSNSGGHGRLD